MEVCDIQNPCPRWEHLSAPVFRKKRSQTKKKSRLVLEKPMVVKQKSKQVSAEKMKKSESIKRKRAENREIYADSEAKFTVLEKAERVFTSLDIKTPFFLKYMLPSNVTYSFWMIMPKWFCNSYLPSHDATIILVDEWGKEHKTTYLMDRHGLSAGWRGFAMSHVLLKGDVLIFNLIEHCKFKIHIVRVNGLEVVNAAICLMNMDAFDKTTESDLAKQDKKKRRKVSKYADTTVVDAPRYQIKVEEKCNAASASQSQTYSDSLCSEVQGAKITEKLLSTGHRFPETAFACEPSRKVLTCM